jgi:peptidyl-tRNA hydrolase
MKFEAFNAPSYFDTWCVRSTADKDFKMTIHLTAREDAEHAKSVIEEWVKQGQREILLEAADLCDTFASKRCGHSDEIRRMAEEIK